MYHIGNGCVTMEEPFSGFVRDTNDTSRTGRVLTAWFTVNSLYDKGTVSISVLNNLCQYFGIGELTRKVRIIRTVDYFLNTPI
jgi:hypothetical protein